MRCLICRGEDIQTKQVREEIKVDNNIMFATRAGKDTTIALEEMEHKLQSSKIHLQEVGKVLELME